MMASSVIIQFTLEGFHNYPEAPDRVKFLSDRHRHSFEFKAAFNVSHDNREKEIFLERERVANQIVTKYSIPCEFGSMSCEMIAREILLENKDEGMIWCEVWEENTGGARVELEGS